MTPASALRLAVCPLDALPRLPAAHDSMDFVRRIERPSGGADRGAKLRLGEVIAAPA